MGKVINIFDAKKKQCEKKGDSAGYNFAEVMKKNAEREKRLKEQRLKDTQDLAKSL
jgi:hypothetical protein